MANLYHKSVSNPGKASFHYIAHYLLEVSSVSLNTEIFTTQIHRIHFCKGTV